MKKSDKKIENTLRETLTDVCSLLLDNVEGFKWLTHFVNYSDFPNSLSIVCIFETREDLSKLLRSEKHDYLLSLIKSELKSVNIQLNDLKKQVSFDTEEACAEQHDGKWNKRFQ